MNFLMFKLVLGKAGEPEGLMVVRDGNKVPEDGHEESFCGDGHVETLDCGESTIALQIY